MILIQNTNIFTFFEAKVFHLVAIKFVFSHLLPVF